MANPGTLHDWVEDLPARGRYTFSRAEALSATDASPAAVKYDFRVFLLKLGLIGDELRAASRSRPSDSHLRCSRPVSSLRSEAVVKTARLHLLARLNNSTA